MESSIDRDIQCERDPNRQIGMDDQNELDRAGREG